jgi:DNA-nicking Smr family endonuclease
VIEPNRQHRIAKEREEIGARLDLHGLDQDRARVVLENFLRRAWDEGWRAVLVITGKGVKGDGILRRRAPEWLAAPHLSPIVAGISEAHRRHGGEGALYVALKRKPRG